MAVPLYKTTDKPCEICGSIGYVEAIIICSKCKVTREHRYCTNIMYEGDQEKWICEDCDVSNKKASSKPGTGMQFMIKKPPKNSKVQYLAPEEIRLLESGGMRNTSLSPSKSSFVHRPSDNKQFMSGTKAIPSSFLHSNLCVKPDPAFESSRHRKSLNNQNMSTSLRDRKFSASADGPARQYHGGSATVKHVTFEKFPKPGVKFNSVGSDHAPLELVQCLTAANSGAQQICRDSQTAKGLHVEELRKNEKNTVHTSQLVHSLVTPSSGIDDSKGRESLKVSMVFDIYLPNHPAMSPTWKGTLKIINDVLPCSSFDEMQAIPPCKVNTKAYKFSKELPKILQFEMLPQRKHWVDIFKDDVISEFHIGLYFLHSTRSNLNGNYCSLLEYLDDHNLLLRTCIDGVELFVFSSTHLPEASCKINQKQFLWGLFRPSRDKFSVASSDLSAIQQLQQPKSEEPEADDMDVDMLGGHEVGKADIIAPKYLDHAHGDCREGKKEWTNDMAQSPADFSSIKIKKEWTDDMERSPITTPSFLDGYRAFEEELQKSFDRFMASMV